MNYTVLSAISLFTFRFLSVLASSLVFNLADGQFSSRADLIDAPGSSLGRGAQVAGLGELTFRYILLLSAELTEDSHTM